MKSIINVNFYLVMKNLILLIQASLNSPNILVEYGYPGKGHPVFLW